MPEAMDNHHFTTDSFADDRRLMELLSQNFPTVSAASTEIINLEAILNLPKAR